MFVEEVPLKVGDVVVLNSGGPPMTITEIGETRLACSWISGYDEHSPESHALHEAMTCPIACVRRYGRASGGRVLPPWKPTGAGAIAEGHTDTRTAYVDPR